MCIVYTDFNDVSTVPTCLWSDEYFHILLMYLYFMLLYICTYNGFPEENNLMKKLMYYKIPPV